MIQLPIRGPITRLQLLGLRHRRYTAPSARLTKWARVSPGRTCSCITLTLTLTRTLRGVPRVQAGEFGTKTTAVVRRLKWILRDPEARVLVFSEWADVLQLVAHAAAANAVPYLQVDSSLSPSLSLALSLLLSPSLSLSLSLSLPRSPALYVLPGPHSLLTTLVMGR